MNAWTNGNEIFEAKELTGSEVIQWGNKFNLKDVVPCALDTCS